MNILIIDDDKKFITVLKKDLYNHFYELCDSNIFNHISDDFNNIKLTHEYDFIFLDIDLIQESGISLAQKIKETNNLSNIVFITAHSDLIFNTLSIQPFFFIRKHHYHQDLQIFFDLVDKQLESHQMITIKSSGEKQIIPINQITYIEPFDRLLLIHTTKGDFKDDRALNTFIRDIDNDNFIQIHKSYIINFKHLLSRSTSEVNLTGNITLNIGRAYKNDFNKKFEENLLK